MSSLKQCDPDQQIDSAGLRSNKATKPFHYRQAPGPMLVAEPHLRGPMLAAADSYGPETSVRNTLRRKP